MRRRLKFLTSAPLIIGVFVIVYAGFGVAYFSKQRECHGLESQIMLRRTILQKPQPDIEELKAQLEEAQAESEAILISLPNPGQGIDIYGSLVDLGRQANVEILGIAAYPPIEPKDGQDNKTILPYSMSVRGSQSDLLRFISSLIQGSELLQGLEVRSSTIRWASPSDPGTVDLELYINGWPDSIASEQ